MRKIIALLCLVPSVAFGQVAGTLGCYVDSLSYPDCASDIIVCSPTKGFSAPYYGTSIGRVCDEIVSAQDAHRASIAERNEIASKFSECIDGYNTMVAGFSALDTAHKNNLALVKKLRRVCGKACKRIK